MDNDAERKELEDRRDYLLDYFEHPITVELHREAQEQQEKFIRLICELPITNVESFFAHFEAVGNLRGIRHQRAVLQDKLEELKQQIKEHE